MFTLKHATLQRLFLLNSCRIPDSAVVLVGLRGCLPVSTTPHAIAKEHVLEIADTDHQKPRCTIVIWRPKKEEFALFPASTVPHRKFVEPSLAKGGRDTNQLFPGFYDDYRKGFHLSTKPTGHPALQQNNLAPIRRTADDLDYDENDREEIDVCGDNIHAGWCMNTESTSFASAGCQVIVGYPACKARNTDPATGPWAIFWQMLSAEAQDRFGYLLLPGREAQSIAVSGASTSPVRFRFGSKGPFVSKIQEALKQRSIYEGAIDEDFGPRTFKAVRAYQRASFGQGSDDGVVGPQTAKSLGLTLPTA